MDKKKFTDACSKIINQERRQAGIGTLGEKTLHAVLKSYFEPCEENQEIRIGGYVADISGESGIIEIQTREFNKLRNKLAAFLEFSQVTVVYPIPYLKWLVWIDNETGGATKKRKSPKTGKPYEIFYELYKIKQMLTNPNLKFCIVLLEVEEYRNLDGWSDDKKKGSSRYDRIPVNIIDEIYIHNIKDYVKLIPPGLPAEFTVKDFKAASKLSRYTAGLALNVLNYVGVVERIGKHGNALIYKITKDTHL